MDISSEVFFSDCTQRAVANFVIIVNMPLSADSRDPKPKPRVPTLDSPIPCPSSSPPNNQSNFKVASVGKAQNVASSTSAPLLFLHRPSTSTGGSHFFGGFFVGTSFLTPAFRYVSRLPFHLASRPTSTSCLSMPGRLSWLPLVSRKMWIYHTSTYAYSPLSFFARRAIRMSGCPDPPITSHSLPIRFPFVQIS